MTQTKPILPKDSTRRLAQTQTSAEEMGVDSNIDLAKLTEEYEQHPCMVLRLTACSVVEATVTAHRSQYRAVSGAGDQPPARAHLKKVSFDETHAEEVSITVNISHRMNWVTEMQPVSLCIERISDSIVRLLYQESGCATAS